MARFRKKSVEVEAWQNIIDGGEMPDWVADAVIRVEDGCLAIETLEGVMTANVNDWIIKGVKGEVYPCKPDIFSATYDAVNE